MALGSIQTSAAEVFDRPLPATSETFPPLFTMLVQLLLYYGVLQPIRNNDLRSSLLFLLNFESPFGFAWALIAKINAVTVIAPGTSWMIFPALVPILARPN